MRVETHRFERGGSARCCSLMGEILARLAAPLSCYSHLPLASSRHNIFFVVYELCVRSPAVNDYASIHVSRELCAMRSTVAGVLCIF